MKKFDTIVKEVLLSGGFTFEKDLDYFNKCFISTTNVKHKIVYDSLYFRLGFYFQDTPIEQAFLIGYDSKSFLEWLKEPRSKNVVELAFLKLKPIIDSH